MIFRRSQVVVVLAFILVLNVVGATGYRWIEGWSWNDAVYMTVITTTAVGFHEVHPLSGAGRVWTAFVLGGGLIGLGMWFAVVTAALVRMDLGNNRERKAMKRLQRMKDHVIVCGGGRMGLQIVHELGHAGQEFVVIERDEEAAESLRRAAPEALVVEDDATEDRALAEVGVARAKGLVTCLSEDADNLYVCLTARHLSPDLNVIARAEGKAAIDKMYRAGATHVVSPNVTGAIWVASVLVRPSVAALLDVAAPSRRVSRRIDHATVGAKSAMAGKTLAEARIPDATGLVVIAVRKRGRAHDEVDFNPDAATELGPGDDVIVLGEGEQVERLRAYLG